MFKAINPVLFISITTAKISQVISACNKNGRFYFMITPVTRLRHRNKSLFPPKKESGDL